MRSTQRNWIHSSIVYVQRSAIEYIVDYGFSPVASLVFSAGGLGHEAGGLRPSLASPAPMVRSRARHWYSPLGSGFGSRHRVFLLSLSYISSLFSVSLDRQTIHHLLLLLHHLLLMSTYILHSATEYVPRILLYSQYGPPYMYHPTSNCPILLRSIEYE